MSNFVLGLQSMDAPESPSLAAAASNYTSVCCDCSWLSYRC